MEVKMDKILELTWRQGKAEYSGAVWRAKAQKRLLKESLIKEWPICIVLRLLQNVQKPRLFNWGKILVIKRCKTY